MAAVKAKKPVTKKLKAGKKKKVNKWLILSGVAAVAVIGAVVVRFSSAGSYKFLKYSNNMSKSQGAKATVNSGGSTYVLASPGSVRTLVSYAETKNAGRVCAHIKRINGSGNRRVFIEQYDSGWGLRQQGVATIGGAGSSGNVCTPRIYKGNSVVGVFVENANGSQVGVNTIYGL